MYYYPPNDPEERGSIFSADREARNPVANQTNPARQQQINQPLGIMRKVVHLATFGDSDTAVFCSKFSDDDRYLATGYGDGITRIYNLATGKLSYSLQSFETEESALPVTCVQWRPVTASLKTANVLVTAQADGSLKHWHATSGKCLHKTCENPENHLYAIDFTPDGTLLAAAGRDRVVRIYDETTKALAFEMKEKGRLFGHSNRIFCLKFNKGDSNMLVSGGWDNNVFVYDMRYRGPVHAIYGPHVCGDTLDFKRDGYTMVAGSYRGTDALEVYDMRMMRRSRVIPWQGSGAEELLPNEEVTDLDDDAAPQTDADATETEQEERKGNETGDTTEASTRLRFRRKDKPAMAPFLYTTMINKREDLIFAGGAGKNEMRLFDFETGNIVALIGNLPKSVLCGALSSTSNQFAFGSADSRVRIFDIKQQQQTTSVMSSQRSSRR